MMTSYFLLWPKLREFQDVVGILEKIRQYPMANNTLASVQ